MATDAAAHADTFPKLLIRNARLHGGRPAYRHKDLGIWQVWTWGQVLEEARAYAIGLSRLGLKRGDTVAIVGSNRPRLYWSVMAAQMLGAVPVPVYADAVADELAYVLAHAEVRFAAVEDQEQVDKILSVSQRLPKLEQVVYDEPRGLRDYDHSRLHAIEEVIEDGRAALARTPPGRNGSTARSRPARARIPRSFSTPRAPPVSPKVSCSPHRLHQCRLRYGGLRQAHRAGRGARLSAARLGRRPLSQLCAGAGRRASASPVRRAPRP